MKRCPSCKSLTNDAADSCGVCGHSLAGVSPEQGNLGWGDSSLSSETDSNIVEIDARGRSVEDTSIEDASILKATQELGELLGLQDRVPETISWFYPRSIPS